MYGTRDAVQNWSEEYSNHSVQLKFKQRGSNPCLFYHEQRDIPKFELKIVTIGVGEKDQKEMRVLTRTLRWSD